MGDKTITFTFDEICDSQDFAHDHEFVSYKHLKDCEARLERAEAQNKRLRETSLLNQVNDLRAKLQEASEIIEMLKGALEDGLKNIACDVYISVMGKNERPEGHSTGLGSKIHNIELRERMATSLQKQREALADPKLKAWEGGK